MPEFNLPTPPKSAIMHSLKVVEHIKSLIKQAGGKISFKDYMNAALYAPELGYYTSGNYKIGKGGDFITAPEVSNLFSKCLAKQCAQVLAEVSDGVVFEIGAGLGTMAADILLTLDEEKSLPSEYWILETSPDLIERQLQTITTKCPNLVAKVKWLSEAPKDKFNGIVIGNEIIDALPVSKFIWRDGKAIEIGVKFENDKFIMCEMDTNSEITKQITSFENIDLPDDYVSEINLDLNSWLDAVSNNLSKGTVLLIDYGYSNKDYYSEQHNQGTLACYYQNLSHYDPLIYPGLQDITAHVDFTYLAEAALAAGFEVEGFTTQAWFLLNCGLQKYATEQDANAIKRLTMPNAMGEMFKVIALTRDLELDLLGFEQHNNLRNL